MFSLYEEEFNMEHSCILPGGYYKQAKVIYLLLDYLITSDILLPLL